MAEFTPEHAEAAKVLTAGGFGSLITVYLRHPGSLVRVAAVVAIGMGLAWVFADIAAAFLGWPLIPVAVGIGLLGKAIAESALRAAEKLELSAVFKFTKGG